MSKDDLPELPEVLKEEKINNPVIKELQIKLRKANGKIGGLQAKLNKMEEVKDGTDYHTLYITEKNYHQGALKRIEQLEKLVNDQQKQIEVDRRLLSLEKEKKNEMIDEKNKELKQYKDGFLFMEAIVKKLIGYKDGN